MYKLVGVLGLITFVVCTIASIDLVNGRNDHVDQVRHASVQSSCSDRAGGLFSSCADLSTTTIDDLRSNELLPVDPNQAPDPLTQALADMDYTPAADGLVYVKAGTHVDAPGAMYVATADGWLGCEDWITWSAECNSTRLVPVQAT